MYKIYKIYIFLVSDKNNGKNTKRSAESRWKTKHTNLLSPNFELKTRYFISLHWKYVKLELENMLLGQWATIFSFIIAKAA